MTDGIWSLCSLRRATWGTLLKARRHDVYLQESGATGGLSRSSGVLVERPDQKPNWLSESTLLGGVDVFRGFY